MKRALMMCVVVAGVAGCSNTESDFLCEAELGSPCSSIAQADGAGAASTTGVTERAEDTAMGTLSQDPLGIGKAGTAFAGMPDGGFSYESGRYRVPEVIGRLWIAPYLDEHKILHESRYVHFVVAEARWAER
jgi:conjugal transfer pilus assembly protein TraV